MGAGVAGWLSRLRHHREAPQRPWALPDLLREVERGREAAVRALRRAAGLPVLLLAYAALIVLRAVVVRLTDDDGDWR